MHFPGSATRKKLLAPLGVILVLGPWAPTVNSSATAEPAPLAAAASRSQIVEWSEYGGDAGGLRYSPLADIDASNVGDLEQVWVHRTGDYSSGRGADGGSGTAYELTPILVEGVLYGCSPYNRVFALDPETGAEHWTFDPEIDRKPFYANQAVCRGVSSWLDEGAELATPCRRRILTGTNDARLIALDAKTGRPCKDFGRAGQIDLTVGVGDLAHPGEYQVTSAPAIVDDLVVVGSAVSDNQRTDAPSGVVRAFDVRTGALRWAWNPGSGREDRALPESGRYRLGTANVWAPMSVDAERGLVFLPTGNTAPDYYGGLRAGTDRFASAVVALHAATGEVAWSFQTVHHDLWDFDVPAQPTLTTLRQGGVEIPVVVQPTKMGHVFVLHRETGVPVFPVEERPVPQGGVPGETLSPTQPFPTKPPPLIPASIDEDEAWGLTPFDRGGCRERIASLRNEGIFTPPSLKGTLMIPGNAGGSNWGGVAVDPVRQVMIANLSHLAWVVSLFAADEWAARRAAEPGVEISAQRGTPYGMRRVPFVSGLGLPCIAPPWGILVAVDLSKGEVLWKVPHGSVRDLAPVPIPWTPGTPTLGGPLVTAGGLIFIGATLDHYLRAYDSKTGETLWKARLDAPAIATPMTYRARPGGRQFVVVAAGGHARSGSKVSDALVAFALPE